MVEERYISAAEAEKAKARPVALRIHKDPPTIAPNFLEEVRKYLEREYGSQRIYQGGLRVDTTLDPALQKIANDDGEEGTPRPRPTIPRLRAPEGVGPQGRPASKSRSISTSGTGPWLSETSSTASSSPRIGPWPWSRSATTGPASRRGRSSGPAARTSETLLPRGTIAPFAIQSLAEVNGKKEAKVVLEQEPKVEGALVAMDVKTGAVRAMVGGYDFERSKFNRATQAMRQVGSAFKPFIYSAAIETMGWTPATIIVDSPISFPNPWNKTVWSPKNYDGDYWGPIPLRRALEHSRNIPAVKTLQAEGVEAGIEYARKMGITGELPPFLPIALGAGEATPIEMAAAYGTFAEPGPAHEAHADHPHHRPRRQRDRGGSAPKPRTRSAPTPPTS